MAIDTSTTIPGMDLLSPSGDDVRAEGAGQIRHIKSVLVNSFPNLNGPINSTPEEINTILPKSQFHKGQIMMYAGEFLKPVLDAGWVFCDGNLDSDGVSQPINGVAIPDLRGRYIKGASRFGQEETGGNSLVRLSEYLNADGCRLSIEQMPSHHHEMDYGDTDEYQFVHSDYNSAHLPQFLLTATADSGGGPQTNKEGSNLPHYHGFDRDTEKPMDIEPDTMVVSYIIFVGKLGGS